MKSPGVIYRRYRQLRKKILYDKTAEAFKRKHSNCKYGKTLKYLEQEENVCYLEGTPDNFMYTNRTVNLCLFPCTRGEDPEICDCPQDCNAFVNKWSKKSIENQFNNELTHPETKYKFYPELCVLEWVLDKNLYEATKEPSIIGKFIIHLIRFLENLLKKVNK